MLIIEGMWMEHDLQQVLLQGRDPFKVVRGHGQRRGLVRIWWELSGLQKVKEGKFL